MSNFVLLTLLASILTGLMLYILLNISDTVQPISVWIRSIFFEEDLLIKHKDLNPVKSIFLVSLIFFIYILYSFISAIFTQGLHIIKTGNILNIEHDFKETVIRALKWNFRRILLVLSPLLTVSAVGLGLLFIVMILFDFFIILAGISIGFVTFIFTFGILTFIFTFLAALAAFFWNIITSAFGIDIAVGEPELSNNGVRNRSRKLAFVKPQNIGFYLFYLVFIFALIAQSITVILFKDLVLESGSSLLAVILLDLVAFLGLKYLKNTLYMDSLMYQYEKIYAITRHSQL
jgi:hypothetical protein